MAANLDEIVGESLATLMRHHALVRGDSPAITLDGDEVLTFAQLDTRANSLAHHLKRVGVTSDRYVTIAEPNSFEFFIACAACWKIGAIPQPVSSRLPAGELDAIVDLADSAAVIGVEHVGRPSITTKTTIEPNDAPLPDVVASAWKAPTSGGSTGRPKLIVSGDPSVFADDLATRPALLGCTTGETMVMPGPMYHNGPFIWGWSALFVGGHIALSSRFDAHETLAAIERNQATSVYMVPTMMLRIWKLPEHVRNSYDLSSVRFAWHLAEPCPPWLKDVWIDWIGAENIWELYGGTEGQASTVINGVDWLKHRGSVGKPATGTMKICDDAGADLAADEVGEVWMRTLGRDTPTYHYVGAEAESRDGWECLGDIGWMDSDGFLYLADRRTDMILVGGANVFPAEVEAAINLHPDVGSSAVIGLPDDDKGNQIHAIVQAHGLNEDDLLRHLAEHLVAYKRPRTIEFVDHALRDDAGKVRRGALRAERLEKLDSSAS
ncbi:MAG: AMP-binding protein [Actinobacteria bacterium]|nr:AMP-binding protein [Actinomycetota bacterium]